MIVLFWIAVGIYGLGVLFTSITCLILAATAVNHRDKVGAARFMLVIPVWPIYAVRKIIVFIAESLQIIKEEKK